MAREKKSTYRMQSADAGGPMRKNFPAAFRKPTEPVEGGTLPEVEIEEKKTEHKDVSSQGGWNEEITKGIKDGTTKVLERADGSKYIKQTQ